ncbi:nicotinamide riboside transporter PnuC [Halioxenophilus sp. WMMB6]|uniref:nicotinamide riboside transporter PnuC n=1 Tax=Halioxenophilus sp. WMMB6 TaxID=3073815 RepID=UPI00295E546F|nr:nicotinamide riboside transporter PnuC [Halioxenophilus sp. WMMB6]
MTNLVSWLAEINPWELLAVVLAVAYLWLMVKERIEAWYCAFFSSLIYTLLFWHVSLLMESALNIYYVLMAAFGWWQWRYGGQGHEGIEIHQWQLWQNAVWLAVIAFATVTSGWWLSLNTDAAWPYVDSFTTWAAVFTTYLAARKVLQQWLYWIVIDSVSIALYIDRGLYLTALLFAWYVGMCVVGYYKWLQIYRQQQAVENPALVSAG